MRILVLTVLALVVLSASVASASAPVERTGQTSCFDSAGNPISCGGTGQDGALLLGIGWPSPRLMDNGDGTVTDNLTGLVWLKNADCFNQRSWLQALQDANSLGAPACGLSDGSSPGDWRLPNIKELQSLMDFGQTGPVLPQGYPFTSLVQAPYWSSTTRADAFGPEDAHAMSLYSGNNGDYSKGDSNPVLAVRGPYTVGPAPVEVTGQTICYDDVGTVIDCSGTGQDGDLQIGVTWPEPRFTDNGDGTVTDNLTALLWLKNANCFGEVDWSTALDSANAMGSDECDLSDGSEAGKWHLANARELQSLTNFGAGGPSLPAGHPFVNVVNDDYWSSTTSEAIPDRAWRVNFNSGGVQSVGKSDTSYAWPVRLAGLIFSDGFESGYADMWSQTVGYDDHGNDAGDSTPLIVPSDTPGSIEQAGDIDWFRFDSNVGTIYVMETTLGTLPDSVLNLYATDGITLIESDDDGGQGAASRIEWLAPASGTFFIEVTGFDPVETGSYSLSLTAQ